MSTKKKVIILGLCIASLIFINLKHYFVEKEIRTVEFMKEDIFSNLLIDEKELVIPLNDKKKMQMIGLDNKNIYCQYQFNEETFFGIYNREKEEYNSVYNMPNEVYAFLPAIIINTNIYLLESYISTNNNSFFSLKKINEFGNVEEIFRKDNSQLPNMINVGEWIILNYSEFINKTKKMNDVILAINTNTDEKVIIENVEYEIDDTGLYEGEIIADIGGIKDGVWYESISLNGQNLHNGEGVATAKFFSLEHKKIIRVEKLPNIMELITGDENMLITSDYAYERALDAPTKMWLEDMRSVATLEGFNTTNNISAEYITLDDKIILGNRSKLYIYDIVDNTYDSYNYQQNTESRYSQIYIKDDEVGYSERFEDKIIFRVKKLITK